MEYTVIEVPRYNDSFSRIVLNSSVYNLRFTYNDTWDYWKFGLYDSLSSPISIGIKIVPGFPLNIFSGVAEFPSGFFFAKSSKERIGHEDFWDGTAQFIWVSV